MSQLPKVRDEDALEMTVIDRCRKWEEPQAKLHTLVRVLAFPACELSHTDKWTVDTEGTFRPER